MLIKPYRTAAFTLMEISIVLTIIALLVGGTFYGRELIKASALRAQIQQVDQFTTAYQFFREKYDCIPGDCAKASRLFEGGVNGNGNGYLENSQDGNTNRTADGYFDLEQREFFNQLKAAELIPLDYSTVANGYPEARLAPGKGFTAASDFNPDVAGPPHINNFTSQSKSYFAAGKWKVGLYFAVGAPKQAWGWKNDFHGLFTPTDTYYLDMKMDDGNPQTGRFLAGTIEWTNWTDPVRNETGTDGYCLDNTPHSNTLYQVGAPSFPNAKWETYLFSNPEHPCIFAWRLE